MTEHDSVLRRIELNAVVVCAAMTAVAAIVSRQPGAAALGVLGGGALVVVSYRGIKAGTDALVGAMARGGRHGGRTAVGVVKFLTRYAILGAAAYVIMARLRLPPMAVFLGASSIVVAIAIEAFREATQNRER